MNITSTYHNEVPLPFGGGVRGGVFHRAILHLDLNAFFASVECLRNSSLQGKPLLIGGSKERGIIASCNSEAQAFGIRTGMPMKQALYLCPDAQVLRGDPEVYARHSALVREIIAEQAPVFEQASIDSFYLDLTGMDRYFGCWKWSGELQQKVCRESGLPLSLGLAVNKTVSKVGAGEAGPNGARLVAAGSEKHFLAPLLVKKLPAVELSTARHLALMGVRTCKTLGELPPRLLEYEFGAAGRQLWRKANGEDDSPVVPYLEEEALSEEHNFHSSTIELRILQDRLRRQTAQLAHELRRLGNLTAQVTVKMRYADGNTYTRQSKITPTCQDQALTEKVLWLFERLFERRQLVQMVGVRFSGLVTGGRQLSLFDHTDKEARLLVAMDRVRDRFGKDKVQRAL